MEPIKDVTEEQRDRLARNVNDALDTVRFLAAHKDSLIPYKEGDREADRQELRIKQHGIITEIALAYKDHRLGDISDEGLTRKEALAHRLAESAGLEGDKLIYKAKELVDIQIAKSIPGQSFSASQSAAR